MLKSQLHRTPDTAKYAIPPSVVNLREAEADIGVMERPLLSVGDKKMTDPPSALQDTRLERNVALGSKLMRLEPSERAIDTLCISLFDTGARSA